MRTTFVECLSQLAHSPELSSCLVGSELKVNHPLSLSVLSVGILVGKCSVSTLLPSHSYTVRVSCSLSHSPVSGVGSAWKYGLAPALWKDPVLSLLYSHLCLSPFIIPISLATAHAEFMKHPRLTHSLSSHRGRGPPHIHPLPPSLLQVGAMLPAHSHVSMSCCTVLFVRHWNTIWAH